MGLIVFFLIIYLIQVICVLAAMVEGTFFDTKMEFKKHLRPFYFVTYLVAGIKDEWDNLK
jgi:hypothetical protein